MRQLNFAGRSLLSFSTFNAGWWVCALGPMYQLEWIGPASMPLWAGLHLYFSPTKKGESIFLLLLGILGFAIDSLFIYAGIFRIVPEVHFTPAWLVCMWVLLGITFESMLMMRRKLYLICLMGVMSGPLSYLFAQAMGILVYAEPKWLTMGMHGIIWAVLMPLLFGLRDIAIRSSLRL